MLARSFQIDFFFFFLNFVSRTSKVMGNKVGTSTDSRTGSVYEKRVYVVIRKKNASES